MSAVNNLGMLTSANRQERYEMLEGFLTVRDCARLLGCSRQYVHAEINRGFLPCVSKGNMKLVVEKTFRKLYAVRIEAEELRQKQLPLSGTERGAQN